MSKEGEDILKEATIVFNPTLWIGCQKKFKDVPLYVCNALTELRQIPQAYKSWFPHFVEPVLILIFC